MPWGVSRALKVIFVQETHFDRRGTLAFAARHFSPVHLAYSTKKKAGVAILIKKGAPFKQTYPYSDPQDRYLILRGKWQDMDVTFCNIYASNANQTAFLSKVYICLFHF